MRKFETIYRYARQWEKGCIPKTANIDTTTTHFKRLVYQCFRQELQLEYGIDVDRNTWVFDQNELKTKYTGKETLKTICYSYYIQVDADFESSLKERIYS
jgi:hypothetical protein